MVRTRFAPSPTGNIHIGGLRTALYNYLFARANGGKFVLRIEDTDRIRSRKKYEEEILEALVWLGCEPDEDFLKGGPFGPYRQSERTEIYKTYFNKLKNSKAVLYPCFCTKEELLRISKEKQASGKKAGYDGRCFLKSPEEVERLKKEGKPFSLRLKLPKGTVEFKDLIKGDVVIDLSSLSDPVIMRSDGTFTYHFCVVADDIDMRITHVIRGEDHLVNTAYQLLLYEYLDAKPPLFAHVPLMLDSAGKKLSKRTGGVTYAELKAAGILPEAVVSYLLSAGASKELVLASIDEAVEHFKLEKLPRGKTVFDSERLESINFKLIQKMSEVELVKRLECGDYCNISDLMKMEGLLEWIKIWKENLRTLKDAGKAAEIFSKDVLEYKKTDLVLASVEEIEVLKSYLEEAKEDSGAAEILDQLLEVGSRMGVSRGKIMKVARVALTGEIKGPPLPLIIKVLGGRRSLLRLKSYVDAWEKI